MLRSRLQVGCLDRSRGLLLTLALIGAFVSPFVPGGGVADEPASQPRSKAEGHNDASAAAEKSLHAKVQAAKTWRVVCFGDSVTGVYYHTGSRRAYTDMLAIALRRALPEATVEAINAGISGHTTTNGLARLDRDVLRHKPDLVTVMFGLNDMTRVPLEEYRANLKTIVTRCRESGSEVVLATPNSVIDTPARPVAKLIEYCAVVREVGQEMGVAVSDVYAAYEAARGRDAFGWRLLMSDEIHPNMDGHKLIASTLAETLTGKYFALDDVPPPQPALARTLELVQAGHAVRVLAMPPFDALIGPELRKLNPAADIQVETWPVSGLSLAQIEENAKARVRAMKPDLVLLAVPRSSGADSDEAFARSYAWIMNWSLNFGSPTWDCVVIHPSVTDPQANGSQHDRLIRRLVRAQDLTLLDRPAGSDARTANLLQEFVARSTADR